MLVQVYFVCSYTELRMRHPIFCTTPVANPLWEMLNQPRGPTHFEIDLKDDETAPDPLHSTFPKRFPGKIIFLHFISLFAHP